MLQSFLNLFSEDKRKDKGNEGRPNEMPDNMDFPPPPPQSNQSSLSSGSSQSFPPPPPQPNPSSVSSGSSQSFPPPPPSNDYPFSTGSNYDSSFGTASAASSQPSTGYLTSRSFRYQGYPQPPWAPQGEGGVPYASPQMAQDQPPSSAVEEFQSFQTEPFSNYNLNRPNRDWNSRSVLDTTGRENAMQQLYNAQSAPNINYIAQDQKRPPKRRVGKTGSEYEKIDDQTSRVSLQNFNPGNYPSQMVAPQPSAPRGKTARSAPQIRYQPPPVPSNSSDQPLNEPSYTSQESEFLLPYTINLQRQLLDLGSTIDQIRYSPTNKNLLHETRILQSINRLTDHINAQEDIANDGVTMNLVNILRNYSKENSRPIRQKWIDDFREGLKDLEDYAIQIDDQFQNIDSLLKESLQTCNASSL